MKKPTKFPSEYNHKESVEEYWAEKILGNMGACLGSKGRYSDANPKHVIVFNANVCIKLIGKIWHGDLDLTLRSDDLKALAKMLKTDLFVLYEMDARFENESEPKLDKAVVRYAQDGKEIDLMSHSEFFYLNKNIPQRFTDEEYRATHPIAQEPSRYDGLGDEFQLFEMPEPSHFKSLKKDVSPIVKLHKYFITKYGSKEAASAVFSNIYWTKEYADEFDGILLDYLKKVFKCDEYSAKKELGWATFDLPLSLGGSDHEAAPIWAQKGKVYLRNE